jgi:hypothetical protein
MTLIEDDFGNGGWGLHFALYALAPREIADKPHPLDTCGEKWHGWTELDLY